jgi:hypothetical protein
MREWAALHLLGGTRHGAEPDLLVAEVIWHYSDGSAQRTPLHYLNHIRDWTRSPYEEPQHLPYAFSKAVWRGADPTQPGRWLRLYRVTLANPEPSKSIRQVELAGGSGYITFFVVVATLDSLAPGQRPMIRPIGADGFAAAAIH